MKWFKHDSDMHTDLKVQNLVDKYGLEGYGLYNLCLEMVAKEGKNFKINGQFRWKQLILSSFRCIDDVKLDAMLKYMAELKLISGKSLQYGHLHIPKMSKRLDEYTQRNIGTNSRHYRDNIGNKNKIKTLDKDIDKDLDNPNPIFSPSFLKPKTKNSFRGGAEPIGAVIQGFGLDPAQGSV